MHDLDDLLGRSDAFHHFHAKRGFAHAIHEFLDDLEVHVGFEERKADFTESVLDVGFRELGAAAEIAEYAGESVGQAFEHCFSRSYDLELRTVTQLSPLSQAKHGFASAGTGLRGRRKARFSMRLSLALTGFAGYPSSIP